MIKRGRSALLLTCLGVILLSCAKPEHALSPLPGETPGIPPAQGLVRPRISGPIGGPNNLPGAQALYGEGTGLAAPATPSGDTTPGNISLDFADTDIREVVAQVLGGMLKADYTIDPAVHGNVTLHTTTPLNRTQLVPTLQVLLSEVGATMTRSGPLYRIVPSTASAAALGSATEGTAGSVMLPLHYAGADDLAKLLQPFVGSGKLVADSGRNALLITGEPGVRNALVALAQSFDVNVLAGQSYVLLPVSAGNAKDFATALQEAFRSQNAGTLAGVVRVVPLERIDSVLLISSQPRYIDAARQVYGMLERARRQTVRSWRVYYLKNSSANNIAYILQQAFTPGNITALPVQAASAAPARRLGGMGGISGSAAAPSGSVAGSVLGSIGAASPGTASDRLAAPTGTTAQTTSPPPTATLNPLLGGLDQTAGAGDLNAMRIIPDSQNDAVLVYATPQEADNIDAMLRKIDIVPLQVRIDATIAEVTLNDALQYGTQFFFKSGGINGILSNLNQNLSGSNLSAAAFSTTFPGFVIGGRGLSGAPLAISMLQQVTSVHVLSSPELMVLDNHPARLEVGSLVPFLTQTQQSTLVTNAPIINSIDYHQTGVILDVTPRVNTGGMVSLDISQAVSDVDTNPPAAPGVTINSPTFLDRTVESTVVIQDGQTIGLAGLIRDNISRGNQGVPWLKDVPILGALAGTQDNQRTRTELLVLITPHVIHDDRDAQALTADMRQQLTGAAIVPAESQALRPSGLVDPGAHIRDQLPRRVDQ